MWARTYRSRFRQYFHLVCRAQLDRLDMFTLRELGLKLVPLFPQSGVVNITLLELGDGFGELLLLGSLEMPLAPPTQVR